VPVIDVLLEPLSFGTTWRALIQITILGILGAMVSAWVVLYRLSYGAESLAHGMLPGLVLAALVGMPLLLGGLAGIVVAGILVAIAARMPLAETDTAVAVVVTTLFGVGILMALSPASPPGIGEFLFGNLLGTTEAGILISAVVATAVLAILWLLHHRLLAVGFDGDAGGFTRIPARLVEVTLLILVAVTILVSVQALGTLLVAALLVGPAATSRLVTRRLGPLLATSAAVAVLSGIGGIYASFYLKTAAGASVVILIAISFLMAAAWAAATDRRSIRADLTAASEG
jgi:ABC-type Mn2+/Zn2+ transport system permease subunit